MVERQREVERRHRRRNKRHWREVRRHRRWPRGHELEGSALEDGEKQLALELAPEPEQRLAARRPLAVAAPAAPRATWRQLELAGLAEVAPSVELGEPRAEAPSEEREKKEGEGESPQS